ncbi:serine-rich adhesin for platelets isoform X1 [Nematostella vectensis]|uniref:serine-rich adhesin for platelets isoform X1 n=1 Tax=Nematostella vectensis TaxID=45351 RepID=UPI002077441C|nr:serine-rich adhesin for platelets isoform X1 [Nematostella vectensis]
MNNAEEDYDTAEYEREILGDEIQRIQLALGGNDSEESDSFEESSEEEDEGLDGSSDLVIHSLNSHSKLNTPLANGFNKHSILSNQPLHRNYDETPISHQGFNLASTLTPLVCTASTEENDSHLTELKPVRQEDQTVVAQIENSFRHQLHSASILGTHNVPKGIQENSFEQSNIEQNSFAQSIDNTSVCNPGPYSINTCDPHYQTYENMYSTTDAGNTEYRNTEEGEESNSDESDDEESSDDDDLGDVAYMSTREVLEQSLQTNRNYQAVIIEQLKEIEIALAKNREQQLGLMQVTLSPDQEAHHPLPSLTKFCKPYFKDSSGMGPPDNQDAINNKYHANILAYENASSAWKANDKKALALAVRMQNLKGRLDPLVSRLNALGKTKEDAKEAKRLRKTIAQTKGLLESDPKSLEHDLLSIDWDEVAARYLPKRTAMECQLQWSHFGHPRVNNKPWTKYEDKMLLSQASVNASWNVIAQSLQTNRTPIQCFQRYQRSLNKTLLKSKWTPEEDRQLIELVKMFGEGNWQKVAGYMEGRMGEQVMHRYMKACKPTKKGKWTAEENECLLKAIEEVKELNWERIAELVPGRTGTQCRERYVNVVNPSLNKGDWTKEEDDILLAGVDRYGQGSWSKIAKELGTRTDNQCWRRWIQLRKSDYLDYRFNTLRKKREMPRNFVGRKKDRPTIGPKDLDIQDIDIKEITNQDIRIPCKKKSAPDVNKKTPKTIAKRLGTKDETTPEAKEIKPKPKRTLKRSAELTVVKKEATSPVRKTRAAATAPRATRTRRKISTSSSSEDEEDWGSSVLDNVPNVAQRRSERKRKLVKFVYESAEDEEEAISDDADESQITEKARSTPSPRSVDVQPSQSLKQPVTPSPKKKVMVQPRKKIKQEPPDNGVESARSPTTPSGTQQEVRVDSKLSAFSLLLQAFQIDTLNVLKTLQKQTPTASSAGGVVGCAQTPSTVAIASPQSANTATSTTVPVSSHVTPATGCNTTMATSTATVQSIDTEQSPIVITSVTPPSTTMVPQKASVATSPTTTVHFQRLEKPSVASSLMPSSDSTVMTSQDTSMKTSPEATVVPSSNDIRAREEAPSSANFQLSTSEASRDFSSTVNLSTHTATANRPPSLTTVHSSPSSAVTESSSSTKVNSSASSVGAESSSTRTASTTLSSRIDRILEQNDAVLTSLAPRDLSRSNSQLTPSAGSTLTKRLFIPPLPPCRTTLKGLQTLLGLKEQLRARAAQVPKIPRPKCIDKEVQTLKDPSIYNNEQSSIPASSNKPSETMTHTEKKAPEEEFYGHALSIVDTFSNGKDKSSREQDKHKVSSKTGVTGEKGDKELTVVTVSTSENPKTHSCKDKNVNRSEKEMLSKTGSAVAKPAENNEDRELKSITEGSSSSNNPVASQPESEKGEISEEMSNGTAIADNRTAVDESGGRDNATTSTIVNQQGASAIQSLHRQVTPENVGVAGIASAVQGLYQLSMDYKLLFSRFNSLFLWPLLMEKVPLKGPHPMNLYSYQSVPRYWTTPTHGGLRLYEERRFVNKNVQVGVSAIAKPPQLTSKIQTPNSYLGTLSTATKRASSISTKTPKRTPPSVPVRSSSRATKISYKAYLQSDDEDLLDDSQTLSLAEAAEVVSKNQREKAATQSNTPASRLPPRGKPSKQARPNPPKASKPSKKAKHDQSIPQGSLSLSSRPNNSASASLPKTPIGSSTNANVKNTSKRKTQQLMEEQSTPTSRKRKAFTPKKLVKRPPLEVKVLSRPKKRNAVLKKEPV